MTTIPAAGLPMETGLTPDEAAAPRPLPLHLAIQSLIFATSLAALPSLKNGSIAWKASLSRRAKDLCDALERHAIEGDAFRLAVEAELQHRLKSFAEGVQQFSKLAGHESVLEPPSPMWSAGTTALRRYAADGPPVIVVPSLVNRAHILDLAPDRSLLRYMATAGLDTYLVDWTTPGADERRFDLDAYVDRLAEVRDVVTAATGKAPMLVGYCMGGLLALALAHRAPQKIAKLVMLATPWDFSEMPQAPARMLAASLPTLRALVQVTQELPVDVIQAMFASLDPGATASKFRRFAAIDPKSPAATAFVRLERWLNDGVPLAATVALECLEGWYIENRPGRGVWQNGGRVVDPSKISTPALNIVPSSDIIVPPASAAPLGQLMPSAETMIVDAGHIGMVAGSGAERILYEPLVSWLSAGKA